MPDSALNPSFVTVRDMFRVYNFCVRVEGLEGLPQRAALARQDGIGSLQGS
jgi:hypothetical protein